MGRKRRFQVSKGNSWCVKCNSELPLELFYMRPGKVPRSWCIACTKAHTSERRDFMQLLSNSRVKEALQNFKKGTQSAEDVEALEKDESIELAMQVEARTNKWEPPPYDQLPLDWLSPIWAFNERVIMLSELREENLNEQIKNVSQTEDKA